MQKFRNCHSPIQQEKFTSSIFAKNQELMQKFTSPKKNWKGEILYRLQQVLDQYFTTAMNEHIGNCGCFYLHTKHMMLCSCEVLCNIPDQRENQNQANRGCSLKDRLEWWTLPSCSVCLDTVIFHYLIISLKSHR